jgi:hypothetical protein
MGWICGREKGHEGMHCGSKVWDQKLSYTSNSETNTTNAAPQDKLAPDSDSHAQQSGLSGQAENPAVAAPDDKNGTPRTDAEVYRPAGTDRPEAVDAAFARQLERELAMAVDNAIAQMEKAGEQRHASATHAISEEDREGLSMARTMLKLLGEAMAKNTLADINVDADSGYYCINEGMATITKLLAPADRGDA